MCTCTSFICIFFKNISYDHVDINIVFLMKTADDLIVILPFHNL